MAAIRHSPFAIRQWLVRLGSLNFNDFLLLTPQTLDFGLRTSDLASDWSLALNNAPDILDHFRFAIPDFRLPDSSECHSTIANRQSSIEEIHAAQQRLVTRFALDLLKAKAPPLYDALPWNDWDFSIVAKRFPLWKTRLLLAGDGTTVTACRCRKSAGVYVLEPDETIARYIEAKCTKEKVRRFKVIRAPLDRIPLPDGSVDVVVVGSASALQTANCKPVIHELLRVSTNILVVECSPLAPPLDQPWLAAGGFVSETVEVRGLGPRPCHWFLAPRDSRQPPAGGANCLP